MNNSSCHEINLAIELTASINNFIKEISTGWTKANAIFYMQSPLNIELRQRIENEIPKLTYWKRPKDIHYPPEQGFFCNDCKIGISFPMEKYDNN